MKYKLHQILTIKRFHIALILIFLSIGINDFFIMSLLNKVIGSDSYLLIFRSFVIMILILFGLRNFSYISITNHNFVLFLLVALTILIGSFNSLSTISSLLKYLFGHVFYICIIIYLLQTKEIYDSKTFKLIGLMLIVLGAFSSIGFFLSDANTGLKDPSAIFLNMINFPTFGFIGFLIITYDRALFFHLLVILILMISYLEINRSLFLSVIVFYLIIQNKDFGFFKNFSYSTWIFLSLIFTLVIGIIEFDQSVTTTMSSGRGHIWMLNWIQFLNLDLNSILFGTTIDYNNVINVSEDYSQINTMLNYQQLHSVSLKTLLDYGIFGFIFIIIIFKNKKNYRSDYLFYLSSAIFFTCFTLTALNSVTNFIKMDLYGLLMFISLAASNQKFLLKS